MGVGSYFFYDLETSGLSKSFDQVLQFAAIRTDLDLKPLDRIEIRFRLRPDVIPSPYATLTHRIDIGSGFSDGVSEYEGISIIHRELNRPGTVSVGYNTLGFDDEFLRFAFHRNLLTPYTHQYANGCGRMDLLPMAAVYRFQAPEGIKWPEGKDGKGSLKLEDLNAANGFYTGRSHDAMVDVEVTVALARALRKQSAVWDYLIGYFDKKTDKSRVDTQLPVNWETALGMHALGLAVEPRFGFAQAYRAPVLGIGASRAYKNQSLWLRLDTDDLKTVTPETIPEITRVVRKRFGEPAILLPPYERYWSKLGEELERKTAENLDWLKANPELFYEIAEYHRSFRYPEIPNLDSDAALYQNGFLTREEEALNREFHAADIENRMGLLNRYPRDYTRELATRLLFRNDPDLAEGPLTDFFKAYMAKVNPAGDLTPLVDYRGESRMTPARALEEINTIRNDEKIVLDDEQKALIEELRSYITSCFPN